MNTEPQEPRRQKITQCHCGCAASVHDPYGMQCLLCSNCPTGYLVRTAPLPDPWNAWLDAASGDEATNRALARHIAGDLENQS